MVVSLEVKERAVRPRSVKNTLRSQGYVPAIVYGNKLENTAVAIADKELERVLRENGKNSVVEFTLKGKKVQALFGEQQVDTFTKVRKHIEIIAVDMNEEQEVEAEVSLVGDAPGVKNGGVLVQNEYTIQVSARPDQLPDVVEVDVTSLEIGDVLTVADVKSDGAYRILGDPEDVIASVVEKAQEVEEETSAEAAEPEVIGESSAEE